MVPTELQPQVIQDVLEINRDADMFGAQFFDEVDAAGPGQQVNYDVIEYSRGMADHVAYDSPVPLNELPARGVVSYKAPTIKEGIRLTPEQAKGMRDVGTFTESQRESIVGRAVRQSRIRVDQRREWWRWNLLTGGALLSATGTVPGIADGNIYYDFPASAPAAPLGYNMGAAADHIEAHVPGSTSWADPTADILGDLNHLAEVIEEDSGVTREDLIILMNLNVHNYLLYNNEVQNLVQSGGSVRDQVEQNGLIQNIWGYEIAVYSRQWQIKADTMNDAAGTEYYIPDNVVIGMAKDNVRGMRQLIGCEPSDMEAPRNARGFYVFQDSGPEHPHVVTPGIEFTGGPAMVYPDTWKVYKDVTVTT